MTVPATAPGAAGAAQPRLVLISCGARKAAGPAIAGALYTGPYFRACLQAAVAIAPRSQVLIISARHGLLGLDDGPIAPYEQLPGRPGAVTAATLRTQAAARGITGYPVTALCGARYARLAEQVWADVATPLAGLGIGRQRQELARLRACGDGGSG
jgi:hypothetical protein